MIELRAVRASDADDLFPLIFHSRVTDTLAWDGPASLAELRQDLAEREVLTARSERHIFTIVEQTSSRPVGSASIRPDGQAFRADVGLWVAEQYQGRGYGTLVVRRLIKYGFERLGLEKIEASIFTGNWASRRIFEKNGFLLEGTIRSALRKRGRIVDEWLVGLTRPEYATRRTVILHLCPQSDWQAAQAQGVYRATSLESEGFIHCSRPEQLLEVANRYYQGAADLVLLWIELGNLEPEVRWEGAEGDDYPHIYGPVDLKAISAVTQFEPDADGRFRKFPAR